jgi:hypothetical protein
MNNCGYWIDVRNGQCHGVDLHAKWIQDKMNCVLVGIDEDTWNKISKIDISEKKGEDKARLLALRFGKLARMRAHRGTFVFEFADTEVERYLKHIRNFLKSGVPGAGPLTWIQIINLQEHKAICGYYRDLQNSGNWTDLLKDVEVSYYHQETREFADSLFGISA